MIGAELETLLRRIVREELEQLLAARDRDATPDLLTVRSYAERHSISQSTVRQAIRDGRLQAQRIGRAVRVPARGVIAPRADAETPDAVALRILAGGAGTGGEGGGR